MNFMSWFIVPKLGTSCDEDGEAEDESKLANIHTYPHQTVMIVCECRERIPLAYRRDTNSLQLHRADMAPSIISYGTKTKDLAYPTRYNVTESEEK
jgi:hypothetical protein